MKKIHPDPEMLDDENPEWTEADFKRAVPLQQALPDLYEALVRQRGRPKVANPKVNATLRLDARVLAAYKATGKGWQTRINALLRAHMPETQA